MADLVLGTRGSKLALTQSEQVAAALRRLHPGLAVELRIITTQGDRVLDVALSAVGDKGLFVKELEQALLAGEVDFCVHSCKDLPSLVPAGLTLAAFPERVDGRDLLVLHRAAFVAAQAPLPLAAGTLVGTSSLRRACQLRALRPDLELRDVRGNVDTRLRKLREGQYGALVLAAAGLQRLGLVDLQGREEAFDLDGDLVAMPLPISVMLPAVAQGILAIEARADDQQVLGLLAALDHGPSRAAALAERALLRRLEGGCQVPIAAYAGIAAGALQLQGLVGSLDGRTVISGERSGTVDDPEGLGTALAGDLLDRGAAGILEVLRSSQV